MKDFVLSLPTHILFGDSHEQAFYQHVATLGKHVLLVTGGGSVERLGYLERVTSGLQAQGLSLTHFGGIEPNPISHTINKAAAQGSESGIDVVVALGGGSAMDAAKAIACLIHERESDIWPFVFGESRVGELKGALPLACIPTTAATASEVTPYAVVSKPEINGKAPIAYEFIKPKVSWINPQFTTELPAHVTQDGAADILSHVFENYLLGGDSAPLTDRYCEGIIETVMETLPQVLKDPQNASLRGSLLWCSTLALGGLQSVGRTPSAFPLHAIEHALSGVQRELAHGRGLATLFPSYFRWLHESARASSRLAQLGERIFQAKENAADVFIERFEAWLKENKLLQSVSDLGISSEDYDSVANYVVSAYGDGSTLDALGPMTKSDIVNIIEMTERHSSKS